MRRAADAAAGRELRIKAKLQEARARTKRRERTSDTRRAASVAASLAQAHHSPAPRARAAWPPACPAQVHDAYKKARSSAAGLHVRGEWLTHRARRFAPCVLRPAQAKAKGAQLVQEVSAVQTDRDELQKKYEAKSRCVRHTSLRAHSRIDADGACAASVTRAH
jgi:hypothetical protein